jgi:hypothetical protein
LDEQGAEAKKHKCSTEQTAGTQFSRQPIQINLKNYNYGIRVVIHGDLHITTGVSDLRYPSALQHRIFLSIINNTMKLEWENLP